MLKPITGLAVAAVGVVGVMVAPAGAQQYPPADNGIAIDCTTPAAGETITVTAHTFQPGADVLVTLDPDAVPLGTGTADGGGAVLLEATIPADAAPGDRTVIAAGDSAEGLLTLTARITVVEGEAGCEQGPAQEPAPSGAAPGGGAAPSDDSGGGALPVTGSGLTVLLLQIGLALAAAGGLFLALASKRRRAAHLPA